MRRGQLALDRGDTAAAVADLTKAPRTRPAERRHRGPAGGCAERSRGGRRSAAASAATGGDRRHPSPPPAAAAGRRERLLDRSGADQPRTGSCVRARRPHGAPSAGGRAWRAAGRPESGAVLSRDRRRQSAPGPGNEYPADRCDRARAPTVRSSSERLGWLQLRWPAAARGWVYKKWLRDGRGHAATSSAGSGRMTRSRNINLG